MDALINFNFIQIWIQEKSNGFQKKISSRFFFFPTLSSAVQQSFPEWSRKLVKR